MPSTGPHRPLGDLTLTLTLPLVGGSSFPFISLPLTFHLELELGQTRAGGHLEVFQVLHDLRQLPLLWGRLRALLLPAGRENQEGADVRWTSEGSRTGGDQGQAWMASEVSSFLDRDCRGLVEGSRIWILSVQASIATPRKGPRTTPARPSTWTGSLGR